MQRPTRAAVLALLLCMPPIDTSGQSTPVERGTAEAPPTPTIRLAHDSERERRTADALRRLLAEYDVSPWQWTDSALIDEDAIPHSHPVLTLHTRHLGNDAALLTTWVHEQLHWIEDAMQPEFERAMEEFREVWPSVPSREEGGASDARSTYRHLIVCRLEYEVMARLVGPDEARRVLEAQTHYEWIYERILDDPRVPEVLGRWGFDAESVAVPRVPGG